MSQRLRIGSLFSGYGGLDMAVAEVLDADVAWHCEFDDAPSKILAHHWPDVPNYRDVTTVDWSAVPPVDIITGGSPCQDLSLAGKRAGMTDGTRSNLWVSMREAIATIRPRLVVWENVLGALSAEATSESDSRVEQGNGLLGGGGGRPLRALGRVLGDLAEIGYDAQWTTLRASDIGAPHHRARVFLIAYPAHTKSIGSLSDDGCPGRGQACGTGDGRTHGGRGSPSPAHAGSPAVREQPGGAPAEKAGQINSHGPSDHRGKRATADRRETPPHAHGERWGKGQVESVAVPPEIPAPVSGESSSPDPEGSRRGDGQATYVWPADREIHPPGHHRDAATHPDGERRDRRSTAPGQAIAAPGETHRCDLGPRPGTDDIDFGVYTPAVRRWEQVTGVPAPAPTEPNTRGNPRLSAAFAEWMMGLPAGHVTDVPGLSRTQQLKALGNGVLPAQAAAAITHLISIGDTE